MPYEFQKSNILGSYEDEGAIILKSLENELIVKGRPAQPLGSKQTWGGKEYIKTASGWKPVGKHSGAAKEAHDYVHGKKEDEDIDGFISSPYNKNRTDQKIYTKEKDGIKHELVVKNDGSAYVTTVNKNDFMGVDKHSQTVSSDFKDFNNKEEAINYINNYKSKESKVEGKKEENNLNEENIDKAVQISLNFLKDKIKRNPDAKEMGINQLKYLIDAAKKSGIEFEMKDNEGKEIKLNNADYITAMEKTLSQIEKIKLMDKVKKSEEPNNFTHLTPIQKAQALRILSCYGEADDVVKAEKQKEKDETKEYQKLEEEGLVSDGDEDNKKEDKKVGDIKKGRNDDSSIDLRQLKVQAKKIEHCGDYGILLYRGDDVFWVCGDADAQDGLSTYEEIKSLLGNVSGVNEIKIEAEIGIQHLKENGWKEISYK